MRSLRPEVSRTLALSIAGVAVRVDAPEPVILALRAMLSAVPQCGVRRAGTLRVVAEYGAGAWIIEATQGPQKMLSASTSYPQVAGAIISVVIVAICCKRSVSALRAAVMARASDAIVLAAEKREAATAIAMHLHARGWRYVSADRALIDLETMHALRFEKLLHVESSTLQYIPLPYRRAVEASPWYVNCRDVSFYAVDPRLVDSSYPWSGDATLRSFVEIRCEKAERSRLDTLATSRSLIGRFAGLQIQGRPIKSAALTLGPMVDACDLLERWFDGGR